jgi:hypothetical protein
MISLVLGTITLNCVAGFWAISAVLLAPVASAPNTNPRARPPARRVITAIDANGRVLGRLDAPPDLDVRVLAQWRASL